VFPSLAPVVRAACTAAASLSPAHQEEPAPFELTPRTFEHDGGAYHGAVGRLRVPENRSVADARTLELAVALLESTAAEPGIPVIYLAGGPGDSATATVDGAGWEDLLARGDVILYDQRGTGRSRPALQFAPEGIDADGVFLDEAASLATSLAMARAAAAHMRA
jgi:pimeloyl-ACP methyl ester carboxylesterase